MQIKIQIKREKSQALKKLSQLHPQHQIKILSRIACKLPKVKEHIEHVPNIIEEKVQFIVDLKFQHDNL